MDNDIVIAQQQSTKFSDGVQKIIIEEDISIDLFPVYDALLEWTLQK